MAARKRNKLNRRDTFPAVTGFLSLRSAWDVLVIAGLLGVVVYLSHYVRSYHPDLLVWPQVRQVTVAGEVHPEDREAFKKIVTARVAKGLFRIPIDQLERELTGLPWVYRVKARWSWPASLAIRVHGQDPIARWGKTGLMNVYGGLFYPGSVEESYTALPMLYGEESRAEVLAGIFERSVRTLEPLGLQLHGLFEDERLSKHLVLSNGIILVLGSGDLGEKITRFMTAYEEYLSPRMDQVRKIDLRYTNGLAVEWKDPQLAGNFKLEHRP